MSDSSFGDCWKLGLPLVVVFGAVAVLLVPLVWSFSVGNIVRPESATIAAPTPTIRARRT
ncbi:MAG: hypothetical protein WDA60_15345 [Acidimicrobiia bacterium]|jgi:hypothetical protein